MRLLNYIYPSLLLLIFLACQSSEMKKENTSTGIEKTFEVNKEIINFLSSY